MDVDTVLGLSAVGVHDAVERWASRTAVVPERQLWLHVEGSEANGGWAAQLAVTHRQQLLLQFRHVLVHHEVSIRGVPAGCAPNRRLHCASRRLLLLPSRSDAN